MAYKYETKNCKHCEYCVKTDKGLYCSHTEGSPKVIGGGWCIDMQEKDKNSDMLPVGTTVHINPEDIKWNDGDLISRSELKKSIKSYADDQYAENEYLCEYAIMDIIDNAPTVDNYTFKQVKELFDLNVQMADEIENLKRPQGEWIIVKDEKWGDNVKCPFCGKELAGTDLNFCCKCGAKLTGSEKMNGGAV